MATHKTNWGKCERGGSYIIIRKITSAVEHLPFTVYSYSQYARWEQIRETCFNAFNSLQSLPHGLGL